MHICTLKQILIVSTQINFLLWKFLFNQIKQEKYIFFYGGKDNEWIQQFNKKAAALANDPVMKDTVLRGEG